MASFRTIFVDYNGTLSTLHGDDLVETLHRMMRHCGTLVVWSDGDMLEVCAALKPAFEVIALLDSDRLEQASVSFCSKDLRLVGEPDLVIDDELLILRVARRRSASACEIGELGSMLNG